VHLDGRADGRESDCLGLLSAAVACGSALVVRFQGGGIAGYVVHGAVMCLISRRYYSFIKA
jgi:hypothetical protein